ncbi:hypothetical protein CRE_07471 [Caenorhabditis remanei]|uniref:CCHC-type domain-containing protein n=1 Tax=Caenorhabditis remanei TaxID=31234 RepID=E3M2Q3_CAERE|nr:hypothetical protein CRE_07471 [Caenorhabditis remanei]
MTQAFITQFRTRATKTVNKTKAICEETEKILAMDPRGRSLGDLNKKRQALIERIDAINSFQQDIKDQAEEAVRKEMVTHLESVNTKDVLEKAVLTVEKISDKLAQEEEQAVQQISQILPPAGNDDEEEEIEEDNEEGDVHPQIVRFDPTARVNAQRLFEEEAPAAPRGPSKARNLAAQIQPPAPQNNARDSVEEEEFINNWNATKKARQELVDAIPNRTDSSLHINSIYREAYNPDESGESIQFEKALLERLIGMEVEQRKSTKALKAINQAVDNIDPEEFNALRTEIAEVRKLVKEKQAQISGNGGDRRDLGHQNQEDFGRTSALGAEEDFHRAVNRHVLDEQESRRGPTCSTQKRSQPPRTVSFGDQLIRRNPPQHQSGSYNNFYEPSNHASYGNGGAPRVNKEAQYPQFYQNQTGYGAPAYVEEMSYPPRETPIRGYRTHGQNTNNEDFQVRATKAQVGATIVNSLMATMSPFSGQPYEFQAFMAQFDNMVHENEDIDVKMKQTILFKLLGKELATLHRPYEYSARGYWTLREGLIQQFGNPNTQMHNLMMQISSMTFPSEDYGLILEALHKFRTYAAKLANMGVNPADPYFMFSFVNKLPRKLKEEAFQFLAYRNNAVSFHELVQRTMDKAEFKHRMEKGRLEEKEVYTTQVNYIRKNGDYQGKQESGGRLSSYNPPASRGSGKFAKSKFTPPSKMKPCRYCDDQDHIAVECAIPIPKKLKAVIDKGLCHNCLSKGHSVFNCASKFSCFNCHGRHFTGHCSRLPKEGNFNVNIIVGDLEEDEELQQQLFQESEVGTSEF